jgi:cytochrome c oxidase cbb3-type subunit 3
MSDGKPLDHEYDGIKELDNPLPGWWLATFYITIVFAVLYYGYYEIGGGPTVAQELAKEQSTDDLERRKTPPPAGPTEDELKAIAVDSSAQGRGKAVYTARCASCHGPAGGGLIGPNLTDRYWIHGGSVAAVYKTIHDGVLDKGMPGWGAMMKGDELKDVLAYVWSLKGQNVAGGKPPQGNEE